MMSKSIKENQNRYTIHKQKEQKKNHTVLHKSGSKEIKTFMLEKKLWEKLLTTTNVNTRNMHVI